MVVADHIIGGLLEGEHDIQSHGMLPARTDMPRLHDATGRAGDDEPILLGHRGSKLNGLLVGGLIQCRASRTKNGHFPSRPIWPENFEGIAEFPERAAEDLQIATGRPIRLQFVRRFLDPLDQVRHATAIVGLARIGRRQVIGQIVRYHIAHGQNVTMRKPVVPYQNSNRDNRAGLFKSPRIIIIPILQMSARNFFYIRDLH